MGQILHKLTTTGPGHEDADSFWGAIFQLTSTPDL